MPLVGSMVGRIRILEALGQGGMGTVYVGYDETLERKVALKAIREDRRMDAEARGRFLREARILSQLDHPGICRIHEIIEEEAGEFLVLELIEGESLKEALKGDLEYEFKLYLAEQVTAALVAAHEKGIAHRDLKPENIMLADDGGVKVLDFGLAYTVDPRLASALAHQNPPPSQDPPGGLAESGDATTATRILHASPDNISPDDNKTAATRILPSRQGAANTTLGGASPQHSAPQQQAADIEPSPTDQGTAPTLPSAKASQRHAAAAANITKTVPLSVPLGSATSATTPPGGATSVRPEDFVQTEFGTVMGTVAYMSPEQARGERVTEAGDLYSLGLVLQELFTGRSPYKPGLALPALLVRAGTGQTLPVNGIDPDLGTLITRLKTFSPEARPTAEETLERLRWIRAKPQRRLLLRVAAILALLLALGGAKYAYDLNQTNHELAIATSEAQEVSEFLIGLFAENAPQRARGNALTVREVLDNGAQQIRTRLNDQPRVQSKLMVAMGQIYRQLGLYDLALPLLEEAFAIRRREFGESHLEVAPYLDSLANLYYDLGEFSQAEPLFLRALNIRQKTLEAEDPQIAASLNNLAFVYLKQGGSDRAEPFLQRALTIYRQSYGDQHPQVANSLNNLGDLYRSRGEHDRAKPYLLKAIKIQESFSEPNDLHLAQSLNNLAIFFFEQGDAAQAEPLYIRTLNILQTVLGDTHPDVATTLNNLAELHRQVGDHGEAEPLYLKALAIQEKALGANHLSTITTKANLADLHRLWGDPQRAQQLYEEVLLAQEQSLGPNHPDLAITLDSQADLLVDQHLGEQAESLYLRAIRILEEAASTGRTGLAITLADLGHLYFTQGRVQEAEALYSRSLTLAEALLAEQPHRRSSRQRLATTLLGQGELAQARGDTASAVACWSRAAEIMEPLTKNSEVVLDLHTHSLALFHLGKVEEARPMADRLLAKGWRDPAFLALHDQHRVVGQFAPAEET